MADLLPALPSRPPASLAIVPSNDGNRCPTSDGSPSFSLL
jgi:hypothetical protein